MNDVNDWRGNEDFALLGRYISDFSAMIGEMRQAMVMRLGQPSIPPLAIWAVFAGLGARQITEAFFTMARLLAQHDADESQVSVTLQARVEREITQRNAFAHGDWLIQQSGASDDDPPNTPTAMILRVGARDPVFRTSIPDLRARCAAVISLTAMLRQYKLGTFWELPDLSLRDMMRMDGTEIVPGPRSGGWENAAEEI